MEKIIYITPHLSTGGLPQYLLKKITSLLTVYDIYCIEYENISGGVFVVQRNKIIEALPNGHFFTLGENKKEEIIRIINEINPNCIHLEEIPEFFMSEEVADEIYTASRNYKIFETSHDSSFDPDNNKIYLPDAFFFVSQWQINQYRNLDIPSYLVEYPIEYKERGDREEGLKKLGLDPNKKHVLNIGLFTPRKNQAEIFQLAKEFSSEDVQFHFVGNQAGNFQSYWEPLLKNLTPNCKIWGERSDVDNFYSCMDLFLFTSRGGEGDKETMPLVLREAIGWKIPVLLYNLDVYLNYFDKFDDVIYLDQDFDENVEKIHKVLNLKSERQIKYFDVTYNGEESKIFFEVKKEHSDLKSFHFRMRDPLTTLVFNNIHKNLPFNKGYNAWFSPNAQRNQRNGIWVEFFDDSGNIIQSEKFIDNARTTWKPNIYPTTEVYINDKLIELKCNPTDHSSFWSFYEIFLREDYKNIQKDDIVVDIGANLGFFSLYAVKMGAKLVLALEPIADTYDLLKYNTKDVSCIRTIQNGVSDKNEIVEFLTSEVSSISGAKEYTEKINHDWGLHPKKEFVVLTKPSSLFSENNINYIDYLKIDCEGAELKFFKEIPKDFLKHNIKKIVGEIHINSIGIEGYEFIVNLLKESGFNYTENSKNEELAHFYAEKKPKIKILHLLNDVDGDREKKSIESLKQLSSFGLDYEQIITEKTLILPEEAKINCNRPNCLSDVPGDYLLTGPHYGCYLSHKKALTENYIKDYDAVLICECDCFVNGEYKEFYETILNTYHLNNKHGLNYTSFGKQIPGEAHILLEDNFYKTKRQSEAHCYLVSEPYYNMYSNLFEKNQWDAYDLWTNNNLGYRGIYDIPFALQCNGESSIDHRFKQGNDIHSTTPVYRPDRIDSDISVIIQSCDNYEKFWNGWYLSFSRYWNWDLKWPIHFCTETKDIPFNDDRILNLKSPASLDSSGFSNRMIDILKQVKTKYVLYMQEDMWPIVPVQYNVFKKSLHKIRKNDWNCLRLHEKLWGSYEFIKTSQFVEDKRILKAKNNSEWLLTHNACIWNREFLISVLQENENPWQNEIQGTVRIARKYVDPKIYHLNERWYYQPGASQGGNLNPFMEEYLRYLTLTQELNKEMELC